MTTPATPGEVIDPSVIRRMVEELNMHRANELINDHYQERMRRAMHPAG